MPAEKQSLAARVRRHLVRNAERYWVPLLYSLAVLYLYREVLDGKQGFGWDTTETYWPDLVYLSDSLKQGTWPLWNPFDRGGYPFSADPQPGMYYPVHLLLSAAGFLTGEAGWSFIQFKMLLHHVIAGVCMHAFLRYRGLSRLAATIGGMALVSSTPWLIHKASNLLMPMAWTPLVWIAIEALLRRPTWRRALTLSASLYLAGSTGSPPGFFYVLLLASVYGVYRLTEVAIAKQRNGELADYVRTLGPLLLVAAAVAFGLLWVHVAPGLALSEHTPRAKRDLGYALSLPLPMWPTLASLLVPTSGQVDAYVGILALLLGASALLLRPSMHRGTPVFFAMASALFLSMSFGAELPVLGFFVKHVPGFGLFRVASRYKCLFALTMAPLTAYGAAALLESRPRFGRETWKIVGLCVVAAAGIAMLLQWLPLDPKLVKRFPSSATPIVLSALAIGLLLASVLHQRRATRYVIMAMPVLMLGDPERYWHHQQRFLEAKIDHSDDAQKISMLPGVLNHELRIYDEFVLEHRAGSRLRVRDFRGYPSGDPLDFQRYREVLNKATNEPRLLEAFNVGYVLHGRHHRNGKRSHRLKQDPSKQSPDHFARGAGPTRRALHPAPIAQWYSALRVVPRAQVLDAMLEAENPTGTRAYAVIEPDQAKRVDQKLLRDFTEEAERRGRSRPGELLSFEADAVEFSIDAPEHGIVVLNEVMYPGWEVTVDGQPATALWTNYLLRGVVVGPGPHTIRWRYHPPGHAPRLLLFLACILVLLAGLIPWASIRRNLRET